VSVIVLLGVECDLNVFLDAFLDGDLIVDFELAGSESLKWLVGLGVGLDVRHMDVLARLAVGWA
jgi:hypothetical protein